MVQKQKRRRHPPLTATNVLKELKEALEVVEPGYPYYDVPQTIKRAIRYLTRIRKAEEQLDYLRKHGTVLR